MGNKSVNISNTHKLLILWCQNGSSCWMLLVRSHPGCNPAPYFLLIAWGSNQSTGNAALGEITNAWTTILKFQEDLVQLKKRAKINSANTLGVSVTGFKTLQTEIKTILPAKHPGGKAIQCLSCLPSSIMKRPCRHMSRSISARE